MARPPSDGRAIATAAGSVRKPNCSQKNGGRYLSDVDNAPLDGGPTRLVSSKYKQTTTAEQTTEQRSRQGRKNATVACWPPRELPKGASRVAIKIRKVSPF